MTAQGKGCVPDSHRNRVMPGAAAGDHTNLLAWKKADLKQSQHQFPFIQTYRIHQADNPGINVVRQFVEPDINLTVRIRETVGIGHHD